MQHYGDISQIVSTTHDTVNRLLEYKNGPDALALYFRYIQQQKMQENCQTKSSVRFMMQAVGRGQRRVLKAKAVLKACGLIEDIPLKDELGRVLDRYVKVKYIISSSKEWGVSKLNTGVCNMNTDVSKLNTGVFNLHHLETPPPGEGIRNTLEENINTLEEKENIYTQENRDIDKHKENDIVSNTDIEQKSLASGVDYVKTKTPKRGKAEYTPEFELFWNAYPKKAGKVEAAIRYAQVIKSGVSHETIMAGLSKYVADIVAKGTEPQYIKHAQGWLNNARWEDEIILDAPKTEDELIQDYINDKEGFRQRYGSEKTIEIKEKRALKAFM